ncbi:MAG: 50S ribosomal protein L17 [Spirochaetes bacterium GWF1_49_6]|nr:MAG: 50S ribosomal protein L17 [Spirochaetes bacterium GWF1_49_6]
MRHGKKVRKLSRTSSHRKALMQNLASALFNYESIKTTIQKAKALRPYAEKLITKARTDTVAMRRLLARTIKDDELLRKLFGDIALRYKERPGGYTRIFRLGFRSNDGTEMAMIELVPEMLKKAEDRKPKAAAAEKAPAKPKAKEVKVKEAKAKK